MGLRMRRCGFERALVLVARAGRIGARSCSAAASSRGGADAEAFHEALTLCTNASALRDERTSIIVGFILLLDWVFLCLPWGGGVEFHLGAEHAHAGDRFRVVVEVGWGAVVII